jgi:alkanesulfonate monooxygenase SsuD/methylene tetrahydromethanopterin reductase-like flavin-dependent oxidoreductase (luciferase family)
MEVRMKYGFVLPYGDARTAANLAREAEQAGWDGFFVWEPVWGIDAWVALTAAAMQTEKIRLGTMLTPISRMRPWKLASETATLDNLSGGRVILSVGLGATDTGFFDFGEVTDRKTRAELLDEGLEILTGLWRGQPFDFSGKHYTVKEAKFYPPPPPVQQPRIPIWVVGAWGSEKSMRRALKYDGILPTKIGEKGAQQASAEDIRAMKKYIEQQRAEKSSFEIVVEGSTPGDDPAKAEEIIRPWREAGATWWIEALWDITGQPDGGEKVQRRLRQGPPGKDKLS